MSELELRFIDEYLIDLNATRAYRRANGEAGTYAASAVSATRLLKRANIRAEIRARREALQKLTRVSAASVVRETRCYAFSDPIHLFEDDGVTPRNIRDIPPDTRRAIASVKVRRETDRRFKDGDEEVRQTCEVIEYKLWPKPDGLDKLHRHLGLDQQPIPPLEALLASLPPELADEVRAALAAALPGGGPAPGGGGVQA